MPLSGIDPEVTPRYSPLMPTLDNPKHEAFCLARVKKEPASTAYVTAGFRRNDSNAARLNRNERIKARIKELQQAPVDEFTMSRTEWLESYKRIAQKAERTGDFAAARACLREIGLATKSFYNPDGEQGGLKITVTIGE